MTFLKHVGATPVAVAIRDTCEEPHTLFSLNSKHGFLVIIDKCPPFQDSHPP